MKTMQFTKYERVILEARIKAIDKIIEPYYQAFSNKIFSLKIELDTLDKNGECEKITLVNHLPYEDISEKIETVTPEIKDYLQHVIERYKVEQMKLKQELENLK